MNVFDIDETTFSPDGYVVIPPAEFDKLKNLYVGLYPNWGYAPDPSAIIYLKAINGIDTKKIIIPEWVNKYTSLSSPTKVKILPIGKLNQIKTIVLNQIEGSEDISLTNSFITSFKKTDFKTHYLPTQIFYNHEIIGLTHRIIFKMGEKQIKFEVRNIINDDGETHVGLITEKDMKIKVLFIFSTVEQSPITIELTRPEDTDEKIKENETKIYKDFFNTTPPITAPSVSLPPTSITTVPTTAPLEWLPPVTGQFPALSSLTEDQKKNLLGWFKNEFTDSYIHEEYKSITERFKTKQWESLSIVDTINLKLLIYGYIEKLNNVFRYYRTLSSNERNYIQSLENFQIIHDTNNKMIEMMGVWFNILTQNITDKIKMGKFKKEDIPKYIEEIKIFYDTRIRHNFQTDKIIELQKYYIDTLRDLINIPSISPTLPPPSSSVQTTFISPPDVPPIPPKITPPKITPPKIAPIPTRASFKSEIGYVNACITYNSEHTVAFQTFFSRFIGQEESKETLLKYLELFEQLKKNYDKINYKEIIERINRLSNKPEQIKSIADDLNNNLQLLRNFINTINETITIIKQQEQLKKERLKEPKEEEEKDYNNMNIDDIKEYIKLKRLHVLIKCDIHFLRLNNLTNEEGTLHSIETLSDLKERDNILSEIYVDVKKIHETRQEYPKEIKDPTKSMKYIRRTNNLMDCELNFYYKMLEDIHNKIQNQVDHDTIVDYIRDITYILRTYYQDKPKERDLLYPTDYFPK